MQRSRRLCSDLPPRLRESPGSRRRAACFRRLPEFRERGRGVSSLTSGITDYGPVVAELLELGVPPAMEHEDGNDAASGAGGDLAELLRLIANNRGIESV